MALSDNRCVKELQQHERTTTTHHFAPFRFVACRPLPLCCFLGLRTPPAMSPDDKASPVGFGGRPTSRPSLFNVLNFLTSSSMPSSAVVYNRCDSLPSTAISFAACISSGYRSLLLLFVSCNCLYPLRFFVFFFILSRHRAIFPLKKSCLDLDGLDF